MKRILRPRRRSLSGFTLTELAIVLGIVSILLGGVWVVAANVYRNMQVNQAVEEVDTILQNMRKLDSEQGNFSTGYLTTFAINANVFPPNMMSNGVPVNPWGTTLGNADIPNAGVSLAANAAFGNCTIAPNILEIVFWGIPKYACIGLLSRYTGPAAQSEVTGLYSDGFGCWPTPATVTPSQLEQCADGANIVIYIHK